MVRQVQPLRISKTTPGSSPDKKMAAASARPLAEISSGSTRRNSPSYNQATRKMIVSRESSPYVENASPNSTKPSPRDFWSPLHTMATGKLDVSNAPDRSPSPGLSPRRRASIEKLQSASRVKNSKIFALESKDVYDPDSLPIVERPVANRPMSQQFIQNSFTRFDSMRKENSPLRKSGHRHKRSETEINVPMLSPTKLAIATALPPSPEKQGSPSPTKSALRASQYRLQSQDVTENDISVWDDERSSTPRALHRHNKSVTFHADPPEVNEYEQQTPEPSVAASNGSREASWDSDDFYDQDVSFERGSSAEAGRDDSFDEDLENADKTPVVLPEHWARMSPEEARMDLVNDEDDVFDSPVTHAQRPVLGRSESVSADGEARPLPPIPGVPSTARRNSTSLTATAERASLAVHSPPSSRKRASCSKEEILQMTRSSSLTLQDRLELMKPEARRGSVSTTKPMLATHAEPEEFSITNLDSGERMDLKVRVHEAEVEEDSLVGDLQDFANAPPRISRESILRKVRNTKYDFDDEESEGDASELIEEQRDARPSYAELAKMDPDEPIPSRENSRETSETYLQKRKSVDDFVSAIDIKPEPTDDESFDMASVPAAAEPVQVLQSPRSPARLDDYERQSSVVHHPMRDESESNASDGSKYSSMEPELEGTVLHQEQSPAPEDGRETLQDAMQLLTVKDYSTPTLAEVKPKQVSGDFMGLPQYLSTNDYSFGMDRYITPSPPPSNENTLKLDNAAVPVLQPSAGLQNVLSLPRAPFTSTHASPPGTPNSVIHHSSDADSYEQYDDAQLDQLQEPKAASPPLPSPVCEEPVVPERKATIKTGGKLKARPSGARADFEAMLDFDTPLEPVPAIPGAFQETTERSLHSSGSEDSKADSALGATAASQQTTESPKKRRQSKRHQLDLDIPAVEGEGWGLDEAFDKVIQDQQVRTPVSFPPLDFACNPQAQVESCVRDPQPAAPTPFSPHKYSAGANVPVYTQKGYLMRQNTKVVV
ncbi:Bud site selection protein bud4, partial [Oleoguttula sp. CCFEE 5521]